MNEVDLLGRSMSPRLLVSGFSEVHYGERPRAWTSGDRKRAGSIWEGHPGRQKERVVVALVLGFCAGDLVPALGVQGVTIFTGLAMPNHLWVSLSEHSISPQNLWPSGVASGA